MATAPATTTQPTVVGPRDGKAGFLGSIGVRFMINGKEPGAGFSLVEHPMGPRALAAPMRDTNDRPLCSISEPSLNASGLGWGRTGGARGGRWGSTRDVQTPSRRLAFPGINGG